MGDWRPEKGGTRMKFTTVLMFHYHAILVCFATFSTDRSQIGHQHEKRGSRFAQLLEQIELPIRETQREVNIYFTSFRLEG
jgi:hypothetical protein